jgi:hypothetical protein
MDDPLNPWIQSQAWIPPDRTVRTNLWNMKAVDYETEKNSSGVLDLMSILPPFASSPSPQNLVQFRSRSYNPKLSSKHVSRIPLESLSKEQLLKILEEEGDTTLQGIEFARGNSHNQHVIRQAMLYLYQSHVQTRHEHLGHAVIRWISQSKSDLSSSLSRELRSILLEVTQLFPEDRLTYDKLNSFYVSSSLKILEADPEGARNIGLSATFFLFYPS